MLDRIQNTELYNALAIQVIKANDALSTIYIRWSKVFGGGILFVFNSSLYEIRNRTSYKNKYQVLNIIESTLGVKAKELDYSELFTDKEKITGM